MITHVGSQRPAPKWLQALALSLGCFYVAAVLVVVLYPDGWGVNQLNLRVWWHITQLFGINPQAFGPEDLAVMLNVLLFIPIGWAGFVLVSSWWWVPLLLLASATVELMQIFIDREPSLIDIATNSLGAFVGVVLGYFTLVVWRCASGRPQAWQAAGLPDRSSHTTRAALREQKACARVEGQGDRG